ncbi:MAG: MFS transporter [Lactobacillus sp.]|jgi:MFS family permease|nr:MFS transporter [Lactobacillus sp.]
MRKVSGRAWYVLIVCCLISLLGFGLLVNTTGLFFAPLSKAFQAGRGQVSLLVTLQNAAAAVSLLFVGKLMKSKHLNWLLGGGFAVIGLCLLSLNWAQSLVHFYIAWTIIGFLQAMTVTLSIPVLLSQHFKTGLGTAMGISLGASALGGTIFNPIIALIIKQTSWRTAFLVEGLLILLLFPLCALIKQPEVTNEHDKATQQSGVTQREALHMPAFYALLIAMFALQLVSGSVQHISGYIVTLGMPVMAGASVVSGVMIGACLGKISIGFCLDHWPRKAVLTAFCVVGLLGWVGLLGLRQTGLLVASGVVLGIGQGVCLVALPYIIEKEFGQRDYSRILALINFFGSVAMSLSVYLNGALFDQTGTYQWGWVINCCAYVISWLLLMSLKKKTE